MTSETVSGQARIIALGNEKGGSGKSTTAMHLIVTLIQDGNRVAALDLDVRQATLSRYLENRRNYAEKNGRALAMPTLRPIGEGDLDGLTAALGELRGAHDYIVIDCPGSDTPLSRLAHEAADVLITPLNDSFVDFDVLARVEPDTLQIRHPSHYAEMVWEQRKRRAIARRPPLDWIVMRNRLSTLDARNKAHIATALDQLAKRIGFRLAPGFSERVIFRELFPRGLTLLDFGARPGEEANAADMPLTMSHVAARQEVRALATALALPSAQRRGTASVGAA